MLSILEANNIPTDNAQSTINTCPGKPFFLQHDFIRKYWQPACLPEEKLPAMLSFADKIQTEPRYRLLAWHFYRYCTFTPIRNFKAADVPDIISGLGVETGMLYILIALSLIPSYIARAERENFPVKYALDAAKRIGTTTCFYALNYDGAFGLRGSSLNFMFHYIETATWRIGRFDFVPMPCDNTIPEIYRKDGAVVAFCADGTPLDKNNDRCVKAEDAVRTAHIRINGSQITGIPIDFRTGLAKNQETSLDLDAGWERVAGPGDWTLFFHIPGGGGMKPELCQESFLEALTFFKSYMPDKKFRLIWSASWIFNPAWVEMLPASNLASLINRGRLFPTFSLGNPGLNFVFGKDSGAPDEFKAVNSVEKAVLQCYRENRLRRVGMFLLPDEL